MTNIDRIEYGGFSKDFVMQRFVIALDPCNAHIFSPVMTSDDACNIILQNRKGLSGFIVKLAFQFKGIIKRTPLRNIAIKIKNKMLTN